MSAPTNADIRSLIKKAGLKQWEVADAIGASETTLCVWLRKPLKGERRSRVENAIEQLRKERSA